MVRAASPLDVLAPIEARVHALDLMLPLARIRTMNEVEDVFYGAPRTRVLLIGTYALLALTLAAGGLYAMMSHAVVGRTRELGLRRALGATEGDVLRGSGFAAVERVDRPGLEPDYVTRLSPARSAGHPVKSCMD